MNKLALVLAIAALGLAVYATWGPKGDDAPKPASAAALEALRGDVATLRAALSAQEKAHEQTATRLNALKAGISAWDERLARLEAKKAEAAPLENVRVHELKIVDADGNARLLLGTGEHGGGRIQVFAKNGKRAAQLFARSDDDGELALYDETGSLRANLGGNDDGGYANFYNRRGDMAAYLGADAEKDCGFIGVYGTAKKEIVGLYGNDKGGVISVRNSETEKQILMIGAAPNNGMGFVGLGTAEGKPALALFVTRNGGQVKAINADGEAAAFIGVSADPAGNGLMYLSRTDGERIVEQGATEGKGGYMSIHNGAKERVLFLGASSGDAPDDGVLEVARKNGKLGVVLRAYSGGSSVRVYDNAEKVKVNLR